MTDSASEQANAQTAQSHSPENPAAEPKAKVPGHFFAWFDSLKQGYENSINRLFSRVEEVNADHKKQLEDAYQGQVDSLKQAHHAHLVSVESGYREQSGQSAARIEQLEKDIAFYQSQIEQQNQTISKLNDRYDAVIFALRDKLDNKELENVIKDISPPEPPGLQHEEQQDASHKLADNARTSETEPAPAGPAKVNGSPLIPNVEQLLQQAFDARQAAQFDDAYQLFIQAAKAGNGKAMGAIGRAHFIGEGVEQDKATGLAWLMVAARHEFEPAMKKVESARQQTPQLYASAEKISADLLPQ